MSDGPRIDCRLARRYAAKILRTLKPLCRKIRVAGSARRRRPNCGDIDFVCAPRDLAAFKARVAERCEIRQDGNRNFEVEGVGGIRLSFYLVLPDPGDLFGTRPPDPFGSLWMCRTGSKEHNVRIAIAAKVRGLHWDPYCGLLDGYKVIAGETEHSIYQALGLEWKHPKYRE